MTPHEIKKLLQPLPPLPGVYRYFNKEGELIYVGKAKNLRKRVASYFTKKPESRKARHLVESIHHLEFTIVDTERDALLLENSLIKNYQPRYNINLKDDKSYPYIVIKNEPFPRVFLTRNVITDGSEYFGPYTDVGKIRGLLELIRTIIPLRTNNHNLFLRITEEGKLRVNPEYYSRGTSEQVRELLTEEDYEKALDQVRNILKGKLEPLINYVQNQIEDCVSKMEFERADSLHQKLDFIKKYKANNVVANAKVPDLDVFTIRIVETRAFVNFLKVRMGNVISAKTTVFKYDHGKTREEMLLFAIGHLRKKWNSTVKEIVISCPVPHPDPKLIVTVPQRGTKKKLLALSEKNLVYFSENLAETGLET